MFVPRSFVVLAAAAALVFGAGCGGNGNAVTADETTDPVYQQAQDLKKQGRTGEALPAFLRVIDRRGQGGAPESHLEAGNLYLNWARDPIAAYYHFSKYLELHPSGPRSDMVRGQRDAAKREVGRVLLAPPADQMMRFERTEEIDQLRRRVQELEAEIQTLRGASGSPVMRAPPMVALGEESPLPIPDDGSLARPAPPAGRQIQTAPIPLPTPTEPERTAVTPGRSTVPSKPTPPSATGRRMHTVRPRDSLWGIARQYYGSATTAARVQGIYEANQDIMRHPGDVRAGMVLRIP